MLGILLSGLETIFNVSQGNQQTEALNGIENSLNHQTEALNGIENSLNHQTEALNGIENSLNHQTEMISEVGNGVNLNTEMIGGVSQTLDSQSIMLSGLQSSMGALGAGSVLIAGMGAFTLYKVAKLSGKIDNLSNEINGNFKNISRDIENGFLDMKYFVSQNIDILIDHHSKVKLSEAYHLYQKGIQNFNRAIRMKNREFMNQTFLQTISNFDNSLVIYNSQGEFQNLNPAQKMKQLQIVTMIESMKSEMFFLIGERNAGLDHYSDLRVRLDKELKNIAQMSDAQTINLILQDTYLIRNNDMKYLDKKLNF
jgi:hypothetical protein